MASHEDDDKEYDAADETVALKSTVPADLPAAVNSGAVELKDMKTGGGNAVVHPSDENPTSSPQSASASRSSKCPILFERSADSWWNPRFDSDALEDQLIKSSFPQIRRRFRFGLGYIMLSCLVWCILFIFWHRSEGWPAFVGGTGALVVVSVIAFALTYTRAYRTLVLPLSLIVTAAMCVADLLTFIYGRYSEMSSVGTFTWSIEIVILMYTLIPMPLYVCCVAGICYSVGFEVLAACLGDMSSVRYIAARALLHACIHAVGIHIFIMSQVRERSTFLKVGQSLLLRRALQTEKQIKHNMIHSLMPPKVAEEVMKSREAQMADDDIQDYLSGPAGGGGCGGGRKANGGPQQSSMTFRTFHMDKMDNVSILFADIVGFTKMSSNKSAEHLVRLLNDLFGRFDAVCQQNNCEKITTLGDCYYCVSGCPEPRPDHAQCCVEMGLAMCIAIQEFDRDHNEEVNMRVGVHTGSVLCGIVGTRRFKFDVWSHDVTLANMMESEGQPGRVHISDKTYRFIEGKYNVEPGEEVQDIRRHKELIELFDAETGKYIVKIIEKGTSSDSQNASSIKTWFIVSRMFELPSVAASSETAATAAVADDKKTNNDSTKVVIDGDSTADGHAKEKGDHKDLSAVQLLGKRDNMMASHEELNGEVSGASGLLTQRATTGREDSDRQMMECLNDERVSKDYLYKPNINQFTLVFLKRNLERAYRLHYANSRLPTNGTALTLAVPSYSSLFDMIVSLVFVILVVVSCFVGFSLRVPWIVVCIIAVVIEVVILLPVLGNVCMSCDAIIPTRFMRFLSSWVPRHLFGIIITSLPAIVAFSAFSCDMFSTVDISDSFYCLLIITAILHYCNFTMLSSWMKSTLATLAGLILIILVGVGACKPSMVASSGPCSNLTGDCSNVTTYGLDVNDKDKIFNGWHDLRFEIILDVLQLLILVFFLNREIEISYRLCFHGDIQAVLDRKKIQTEKEQADSLLHNIVPEHVAHLLKTHEFYSRTYPDVGVIFAKISNFDDFYDEAYEGGKEFLRVLNELMGDFEDLFDLPKYKDVEKIKTIGACLMAASGLNAETRSQNKDPLAHLYALMDFACDLLVKLEQFNRDMLNFKFEMEIGFNYGEVTAGVVGTTKLLYDIWGDAVNVASRMYSTGTPGKIQVTEDTSRKLGEKFEFEYRGSVFVKGKGDMNTYLVVKKKPGATWN